MALGAKPMHVPCGLPINQAARPEHVNVGEANLNNVNVRLTERGAAEKRLGFGAMGATVLGAWNTARGTSTRTTGNAIGDTGGRPYVISGTELQVYDETSATWYSLGRVPEAAVSTRASSSAWSGNTLSNVADMTVCNGIRALATITYDPATGNYDVRVGLETADGLMLRAHESVGHSAGTTAPSVQLGFAGTTIYVIYGDVGSANIRGAYTSAASVTAAATTGWTGLGLLASDRNTTGNASNMIAAQSLTDRVAFAYVNNSGGASQVTVKTINTTGVLETATVSTSSNTPDVIGLEGSIADTLWVAWNESSTVKLKGLTGNSLATVKATTGNILNFDTGTIPALAVIKVQIGIISDPSTPGNGWMLAIDNGLKNTHVRSFTTSAGAATFLSSEAKVYGTQLAARPFALGGRFYAVFTAYGATGHAIVADFSDTTSTNVLRPVANVFPAVAQLVAAHPYTTSTTAEVAVSAKRSASAATPAIVSLDFASPERWDSASNGGSAVIAGGVLSYVDDASVNEVGFIHPPGVVTVTSTATAGTLTGTFSYVATYEQVDGNGDWSISSVSPPVSTGSITSKKVALEIPPLGLTNRQSRARDESVRVVLYRTGTSGSAPYYYVTDLTNDASQMATYTDDTATITSNRLLLGTGNLPATNGSSQDHRAPPYIDHIVEYAGTLVCSSGSDLYQSAQPVIGEGRWFSPVFYQTIQAPSIKGLASMDGALYVLTPQKVFVLAGEAPSDNGAAGGLGTPRPLAADVGCINANSVVVCSAGIFFQSNRGIELLSRAGAVDWVGEQVQDTLATYPVITSAVLDDKQSLVRFTCAASTSGGRASGNGRTLIFDVAIGAWVSEDDVRGTSAHEAAQDACMLTIAGERRYAWLGTDGIVHYEKLSTDSDAYLDGTSFVTEQITLPTWKLGLQQEQRMYEVELLFERYSAAGLKIEIAHDYDGYVAAEPDKTWTESAIASKRQVPLRPKPRGAGVAFRISDTAPSVLGTGRGFSFIGLSADIAPKQGPSRGTPRLDPSLRR